MDLKNQLTKTPVLVLFVILISLSVGTASALLTITLAGNVQVDGDLNVDGALTGPSIASLETRILEIIFVPLNDIDLFDGTRVILVDGFGTGTTFDAEITFRLTVTNPDCGSFIQVLPAGATPGGADEWVFVTHAPYPESDPAESPIPRHADVENIQAISLYHDVFGQQTGCPYDGDDYVSITIIG